MQLLAKIMPNLYYLASFTFFLIGLYIMLTHPNLIKKVIGLNIIDSSIFFFFVAVGYFEKGGSPIVQQGESAVTHVNPLPSGLMLTGIVVSVSMTAFALALIIRVYYHYGTINVEEIFAIKPHTEIRFDEHYVNSNYRDNNSDFEVIDSVQQLDNNEEIEDLEMDEDRGENQ